MSSYSEQVLLGVAVVAAVAVLLVKLSKRSMRWDMPSYYAINRHHWCYTGLFTQVRLMKNHLFLVSPCFYVNFCTS